MASVEVRLRLNHIFSNVELGYWLDLFNSPACKITRKEDGAYYLTACRFEKLTDDEVFDSANKLTTMMTAFAKIELDVDYQSIEPEDEGNSIISIHKPTDTICLRTKPLIAYVSTLPTTLKVEGAEPVYPEPQEHWYDFYLDQCDDWVDHTVMFKALSDFAKKTTSFTLYWVYETIEIDERSRDAVRKLDGVTKKELRLFTESINRYDMEGRGRHAEKPKDDYNRPRMSLSEARTFLASRILKPWLVKKREIYKSLANGKVHAKYLSCKLNI